LRWIEKRVSKKLQFIVAAFYNNDYIKTYSNGTTRNGLEVYDSLTFSIISRNSCTKKKIGLQNQKICCFFFKKKNENENPNLHTEVSVSNTANGLRSVNDCNSRAITRTQSSLASSDINVSFQYDTNKKSTQQ
jgi:hypothetical protein